MNITAEELLLHFQIPGHPSVFILGCLDQRVSLHSQQQRAVNLAYLLTSQEILPNKARVGIVGAGAAGLTLSVGLALRGCTIQIVETAPQPMHAFAGNKTRTLHPNIFEWPHSAWADPTTKLPFLNWSSDRANRVSDQILRSWNQFSEILPITISLNASEVRLETQQTKPVLTWNTAEYQAEVFDAIILAVGFGTEGSLEEATSPGYWENDSLDQPNKTSSPPTSYLVSGCGDGGLIDALRIALGSGLDEVFELLLSETVTRVLRRPLLSIEQSIPAKRDPIRFWQLYSSLPHTEIDEKLPALLRTDTRLTLNAASSFPLTPGTSMINRYLVSRLLRNGTRFIPGRLHVKREGRKFLASFSGRSEDVAFDKVVVRHGPTPALKTSFPDLWDDLGSLRVLAQRDDSRKPSWPRDFFSKTDSSPDTRNTEETTFINLLGFSPHRLDQTEHGFHLFILSGLSASGKDTLAQAATHNGLDSEFNLEILIKISTREARIGEPEYFQTTTKSDYKRRLQSGRLFCPYRWNMNDYGFDLEQLLTACRAGRPLIMIFTKIDLVPRVAKALRNNGFPCTSIFIEATQEDCERRTLYRNFASEEVERRIKAVHAEALEVKKRRDFESEYIFIRNGDSTPFSDARDELCRLVREKLRPAEPSN